MDIDTGPSANFRQKLLYIFIHYYAFMHIYKKIDRYSCVWHGMACAH